MLTATVEDASTGSGVDQNDNSLVRYTIIAHVTGQTEIEVLNFHRAWMKKFAKDMKKTTGARADIDGMSVKIVSPGWTYVGIGRDKVIAALRDLGVPVNNHRIGGERWVD